MSTTKNNHFAQQNRSAKPQKNQGLKILGLIVVALAVIGLIFSSLFSATGNNRDSLVFGRYGNRDISYGTENYFGNRVKSITSYYQSQNYLQDDQFNPFLHSIIWQQAFDDSVVYEAILYDMDSSGYRPSPRAIDRAIVERGPYRSNGQFDENLYRQASSAQKASIRNQFREELAVMAWSSDIIQGQYRSSAQFDFIDSMRNPLKTFNYVTVPLSDFPDESVAAYALENSKLFRLAGLSRITVNDESTANQIVSDYDSRRQEIDAFSSLAQENSQDAYSDDGGQMGQVYYHVLRTLVTDEQAEEVFALAPGDLAGPFDTNYGWMIFRLDEEPEAAVVEDRLADIRSYLLQNEIGLLEDAAYDSAEALRMTALASSFSEAAINTGYEVKTTNAFPLNYGGDSLIGATPNSTEDSVLTAAVRSEEFWTKTASLENEGEISAPIVLSGAVAVFSLASVQDAEEISSDYRDLLIESELSRSRQDDYQAAVMSEDNPLFVDDFSATYGRIASQLFSN